MLLLLSQKKPALKVPVKVVVGDGFEPSNSERADLQSAAFDRFAIPPFVKIKENTRNYTHVYTILLKYELVEIRHLI